MALPHPRADSLGGGGVSDFHHHGLPADPFVALPAARSASVVAPDTPPGQGLAAGEAPKIEIHGSLEEMDPLGVGML